MVEGYCHLFLIEKKPSNDKIEAESLQVWKSAVFFVRFINVQGGRNHRLRIIQRDAYKKWTIQAF